MATDNKSVVNLGGNGAILKASTHNAETFNVIVHGGDF